VEGQPTPPPEEKKKGSPWTFVGLALFGLYVLILVILNDEKVEVHFLFFTASVRKLVLMLLCLAIGFAGGLLFDRWRARRSSR
jgi:uncharacterized integral membrane protein